jgi:hypothetical protein
MLASSSFETFIALQTNAPLVIYPQSKKRASGGGNFTRNGKRLNTLLFLHTADYTESISNKSIIHTPE